MLLDVPSSPNQETVTPTSPQNWATPASAPEELALPSPVMKGSNRPALRPDIYDPPSSPVSMSPHLRGARPLPAVPGPSHSPRLEDEHIPVQYRTQSPPLRPRPANYVSRFNRDPKPLPNHPKEMLAANIEPERKRATARFSATSQLSTIVGAESNFLDIDFDFGEGFLTGEILRARREVVHKNSNEWYRRSSERFHPCSGHQKE